MSAPETSSFVQDLFSLKDLTAVVLGGTGVLGGAFCDALAGAGAHTLVVGRSQERGEARVQCIADAGGSAEFVAADLTQRSDLEALVNRLESQGRTADVVVNSMGVNSATPFLEITDEEWDRIFKVNLDSVRMACQVLGAHLIRQKTPGSIINVASLSGINPLSRVFTYSATKAAVINLTLNLAREWAPHGIRVNALAPGFFPAEQNRAILSEERVESILRHTPMARFGLPEELAGALLLMAAPRAGSFVTGTTIVVDGGFCAVTI